MYTNKLMVENYLQRTLTEHEEAMLFVLNQAVKRWIDKRLNSNFSKVDPTTQYYNGGTSSLDIQPCTDITAVWALNDDGSQSYEYVWGQEYIPEPDNERVKTEIIKRIGCFPSGLRRIAVTARFSEWDGGVPEDIRSVATFLVAGVINQGKNASSGGNVASESLEGHSITYDTSDTAMEGISGDNPQVKSLLEQHKELYV